ncbi:unnamed protein product [Meloidogyne enterolobii]|uniref:Uncharacterized protein n=1 Tax=Meloidogyne enterolobii TaxID=390850 RepID=A0ACB0YMK9_MELEN
MFANIAAFFIVVLQLHGQLNITGANNVGLGNHILQEGKVTLAAGSRVITNNEDIERYKASSADACDVNFDVNGNILPFAYSLTNEEVKEFHNGPRFANVSCDSCMEGCVEKTGLEVRWARDKVGSKEYAVIYVNPIATKMVYYAGIKRDMREQFVELKQSLVINQKGPKFHIKFSNNGTEYIYTRPSNCIENPKENILSPSTWEIVGTSPEPTMNRLLVFHLLPQRATRKRRMMQNPFNGFIAYVVIIERPTGPKCDDLIMIFSKSNYRLLTTSVSYNFTSTTKDPTDKNTSITTTSRASDNNGQESTKISTIKPSFKVGLGDHILQEGKVTLANGSMIVKKEDVEQYMTSSANACNVDFDDEGNIVLHYTNLEATKDKGCTMDLLTNKGHEIVFWTGVHNLGGLDACLNGSDINSNVLPFAYSLTNEEAKKFHNGPIFADGLCRCAEGCVEKTGLEVRWAYDKIVGKENVVLYANPIGTKLVYYIRREWNLNSTFVYFNQTHIKQTVPQFHIESLKEYNDRNPQPSNCIKNLKENILSPSTWEIVGTSPEPKMNRLLVFHLLPQKASRKWMLMKNNHTGLQEYVVRKEHPEGPKCDDLRIIFSRDNYKLLTTPTPGTSTLKATQGERKTTINKENISTSTSSINDRTDSSSKKAPEITETLTAVFSLTTTITKATTTITTITQGSSGFPFFVIIVVILAVIGIGIAVYFFAFNKGSDTEEKDVEASDVTKREVKGEDQKEEDIIGEKNDNDKEEVQKKEDEKVKENKDDVKGDDQKKEHVTEEGKNEDVKKDEQKKEHVERENQKKEDAEVEAKKKDVKGEEQMKENVKEESQKKEFSEVEEKKEDLKENNQRKDEDGDNKAKEKIEATEKSVEDSATTTEGETKEEQSKTEDTEDINEEEEKEDETQEDES